MLKIYIFFTFLPGGIRIGRRVRIGGMMAMLLPTSFTERTTLLSDLERISVSVTAVRAMTTSFGMWEWRVRQGIRRRVWGGWGRRGRHWRTKKGKDFSGFSDLGDFWEAKCNPQTFYLYFIFLIFSTNSFWLNTSLVLVQ